MAGTFQDNTVLLQIDNATSQDNIVMIICTNSDVSSNIPSHIYKVVQALGDHFPADVNT